MIIQNFFSIIALLIATILGLNGQDISYFLNEKLPIIELTTAITIVTLISIVLYMIIPILLFISKKVKKEIFIIYLITSAFLGIPISIWSVFVWAMWMG